MERGLLRTFSYPRVKLPLTDAEFEEIRVASLGILAIAEIEEKFDILISNFTDFELELLRRSQEALLSPVGDYSDYREAHRVLARHLSNFLSSARLYFDQTSHDLSGSRHSSLRLDVNAMKREVYEGSLAFRVLEALRNYTQHRGMPLHQVSYQLKWDEDRTQRSSLRFNMKLGLDLSLLREDGFKASVLRELTECGDAFSLKLAVREYVECTARIHDEIRRSLSSLQEQWTASIRNAAKRFAATMPSAEESLSIDLYEFDGNGHREVAHVSSKPAEYVALLQRKNSSLKNVSYRYVSSAVYDAN